MSFGLFLLLVDLSKENVNVIYSLGFLLTTKTDDNGVIKIAPH